MNFWKIFFGYGCEYCEEKFWGLVEKNNHIYVKHLGQKPLFKEKEA
jgi:hypothetical protein